MSDAIADATTANYIVSEDDTVTKNLGTVKGDYFEISGDDVDVSGHSGLVVDGTMNEQTVFKTTNCMGEHRKEFVLKCK